MKKGVTLPYEGNTSLFFTILHLRTSSKSDIVKLQKPEENMPAGKDSVESFFLGPGDGA